MKIRMILLTVVGMLLTAFAAYAMDGMAGHGKTSQTNAPSGHGSMSNAPSMGFTHKETSQGLDAEFQIMSLASMNMKDPGGASHHVMLKLIDSSTHEQIKQAVGKIKIIGPDKQEQTSDLKDYSGILAANVNFDKPGKYGVICLFKAQGQKHLIKFWYPHQG